MASETGTQGSSSTAWRERDPVLSGAGARVLVVEDDEDLRRSIAEQLRDDGFSVFEIGAGDRVAGTMNSLTASCWPYEAVDLVLLDVQLPGIRGLEVLDDLRATGWTIPVLLMTGRADDVVMAQARRHHVPLLRKPFSLDMLSEAVHSTLLHRPVPEIAVPPAAKS